MISERAVPVRGRATPRRERTWHFPSLSAAPAIAGRRRLMESLGKSVVVQLTLAMTLIAVASLLYMAQESQISVQQINIAGLRSEHMQLVAQNTTLRSRATALQSMQRVDQVATTKLGMTAQTSADRIWFDVNVPPLPVVRPVNADTVAAQRASSPGAWLRRFANTIQSSL